MLPGPLDQDPPVVALVAGRVVVDRLGAHPAGVLDAVDLDPHLRQVLAMERLADSTGHAVSVAPEARQGADYTRSAENMAHTLSQDHPMLLGFIDVEGIGRLSHKGVSKFWTGEVRLAGEVEPVELTIRGAPEGPTTRQVDAIRAMLANSETLKPDATAGLRRYRRRRGRRPPWNLTRRGVRAPVTDALTCF